MSIKELIDMDTSLNFTPDMAYLRYFSDGIPVFLWDDVKHFSSLRQVKSGDIIPHCHSVSFTAETVNKYLPWTNMTKADSNFDYYCLDNYEDCELFDIPDYVETDPLPVKGTLYKMSLDMLNKLDSFYENGSFFNRKIISVRESGSSPTEKKAFAYFNSPEQIGTYNSKTSMYDFDENIDIANVPEQTILEKVYYKVY